MFLLEFFRDTLSGFVYILYLILCLIAIFFVFGIVADRKREAINNKLKEKKKYDIESGKEAAIAAMESKQILDVDDTVDTLSQNAENQNSTLNSALNSMSNMPDAREVQHDDEPNVMVLNSDSTTVDNNTLEDTSKDEHIEEQPKEQGPVIIDSSSIQV